jgi:signal peptidase II
MNFKKGILFLIIAGCLFALDQWSKSLYVGLAEGTTVATLIPGVLDFTLVHNTGAAWGMLGDWTNVFIVIALIVLAIIAFIVFVRGERTDTFSVIALSFLFAGGLGNAVDRYLNGYVIDFINFKLIDFPVFNVADMAITIGVIMLLINIVLFGGNRGR